MKRSGYGRGSSRGMSIEAAEGGRDEYWRSMVCVDVVATGVQTMIRVPRHLRAYISIYDPYTRTLPHAFPHKQSRQRCRSLKESRKQRGGKSGLPSMSYMVPGNPSSNVAEAPTNIQPTHSRKSNAHTQAIHRHQEQARLKAEIEAKRTMKKCGQAHQVGGRASSPLARGGP